MPKGGAGLGLRRSYLDTIENLKKDWELKKFNIYSLLLATYLDNFINDNEFLEFLHQIDKLTGKSVVCYFFYPRSWELHENKEGFNKIKSKVWDPNMISELKKSIIKGTKQFSKYLVKNKIIEFEIISNKNEIHTFTDLGLFILGKVEEISTIKSNCVYIPLSIENWKKQLEIIFKKTQKEEIDYLSFLKYLNKKRKKIASYNKDRSKSSIRNGIIKGIPTITTLVIKGAELLLKISGSSA